MLPVGGMTSRVMRSGVSVFVRYLGLAQRPLAQPWLNPDQLMVERGVDIEQ